MKRTKLIIFTAVILVLTVLFGAGCGRDAVGTESSESGGAYSDSAASVVETSDTAASEDVSSSETLTSAEPAESASSAPAPVTSTIKKPVVTSTPTPLKPAQPNNTSSAASSSDKTESSAGSDVIDVTAFVPAGLKVKPAMWKATDPESGHSIYILGTFHGLPDSAYPLPDYIEQAYAACDAVAVEYDVDKLYDSEQLDVAAVNEYNASLVYTDGSVLSDHLPAATYNALKQFTIERFGGWYDAYDYYNVGGWISTLSSYQVSRLVGFDFDQGVDRYFIARAKADGKSVLDIEPLSAQISVIQSYTDKLGDCVIMDSIENADNLKEAAEILAWFYINWASGNIEEIDKVNSVQTSFEGLPADLTADAELQIKISVFDRNEGMAERASGFLKNGENVFFMVGIAHLTGEKGVPALLADMGYTVERVN